MEPTLLLTKDGYVWNFDEDGIMYTSMIGEAYTFPSYLAAQNFANEHNLGGPRTKLVPAS